MEDHTTEELLDSIIDSALRARASDIHIDPAELLLVVFFRIDGSLRLERELPITAHEGIVMRIKVLARLPVDDKRHPKDGRFRWIHKDGTLSAEVRVSMMPTSYGENAVLRIFDPHISILSLKELGFSDMHVRSVEEVLALRSGLIMVVGPTGSGKTTTLYSMLSILQRSTRLIITVEDPVERRIHGTRQIEVGGSTLLAYVTVLRSILRQDPDVILIGEIRDKESAELAIQSALTGHLVIATLHASSVFQVKKRLLNIGIAEYLIDATLVFALSQRLVAKICDRCRELDSNHSGFYKGRGCKECKDRGVSGRTVISEILKEGESLRVDAEYKAGLGIIPFYEVLNSTNE